MNNSSLLINASIYDNSPFVTPSKIEPDTIAYSSQFYAKNHIPSSQERPGNNSINKEVYIKYKPNYNLYCYK
jgi:hypothetical protein